MTGREFDRAKDAGQMISEMESGVADIVTLRIVDGVEFKWPDPELIAAAAMPAVRAQGLDEMGPDELAFQFETYLMVRSATLHVLEVFDVMMVEGGFGTRDQLSPLTHDPAPETQEAT